MTTKEHKIEHMHREERVTMCARTNGPKCVCIGEKT